MSDVRSATTARHMVTPHLVVRGAGAASEWYQRALGATERGRVPVPGGRFMQIELRFGDSSVMIADEFPSWAWSRCCRSEVPWGRWLSTLTTWTCCGGVPRRRGRRFRSRCRRCSGRPSWGDLRPLRPPMGLARHLRDVPAHEIGAAAAAMFGGNPT